MNIICNRNDLNYAVSLTARAASSKDILTTLGGILLEAQNHTLRMTASNLEFTIQCSIDCTVKEEGSVILPASIFQDIVRKSPVDELSIIVDYSNHHTTISGDKFKMELAGQPGIDFPDVANDDYQQGLTIEAQTILNMLENTIYAAAKTDMRPIFTGVLLELKEDLIRFSATDGFRITSTNRKCFYKNDERRIVIPGKNCQEIIRLLQAIDSEDIEMKFGNGQIMLNIGGVKVFSKLIEGQYPDIMQYLPNEYHTNIFVSKNDLQGSIDRASLVIRDHQNGIVKMNCHDHVMTVHGKSVEVGQHTEDISIESDGKDIKVAYTLRYLQDLVRHIPSDRVMMRFADEYNMLVAKPDNDDSSFALLMPVAGRD